MVVSRYWDEIIIYFIRTGILKSKYTEKARSWISVLKDGLMWEWIPPGELLIKACETNGVDPWGWLESTLVEHGIYCAPFSLYLTLRRVVELQFLPVRRLRWQAQAAYLGNVSYCTELRVWRGMGAHPVPLLKTSSKGKDSLCQVWPVGHTAALPSETKVGILRVQVASDEGWWCF